jgi:hypothetical protein
MQRWGGRGEWHLADYNQTRCCREKDNARGERRRKNDRCAEGKCAPVRPKTLVETRITAWMRKGAIAKHCFGSPEECCHGLRQVFLGQMKMVGGEVRGRMAHMNSGSPEDVRDISGVVCKRGMQGKAWGGAG